MFCLGTMRPFPIAGTRLATTLCLALALSASAQTPPAQPQPAQQLEQLAATQQSALDAGDPDQILSTSRQLAALAQRLLANLDREQAKFDTAAVAYHQSIALDDQPQTHLDLALNDVLQSKPDAALAQVAPLTATQPFALKIAAQAYQQKGDTAAAADALTRAWDLQPDLDTGALVITSDLQAGRPDQANRVAAQMLSRAGDSARLHLTLAEAHHNGGDLNGTITELTRAVALQSEVAPYHLALGNAYWELNENQYNADSLREFVAAQRLSPADYLSNFDLGSILSQYHRFSEAETYLKHAAEADPASPDPWMQIGMDAYIQDHRSDARAAFEKAITLTGTDQSHNSYQIRRAYAVLSRISAEEGRTPEARISADHAEELHAQVLRANLPSTLSESTGVNANLSRAPARPQAGSPVPVAAPSAQQQQLRQQLRAIAGHSLNDAGTVLARNHDYAGALPLFRQATLADPTLLPATRNLGIAAFRTANYDEAITALTHVLQQNPADTLARSYLDQARAQRSTSPIELSAPPPRKQR